MPAEAAVVLHHCKLSAVWIPQEEVCVFVCGGRGAVKNNNALHETLSGKLKRKQSPLKPFAVWIFCGAYYPSEYLSPYIMEFLGS